MSSIHNSFGKQQEQEANRLGRELVDVLSFDKMGAFKNKLSSKDARIAKNLILKGADISCTNDHGWTPLMLVCMQGAPELVQILIEKGADVNVQNISLSTPLIYAAFCNHQEIVEMLVRAGADPRLKDNSGCTAISYGYHVSTSIGRYLEKVAENLTRQEKQVALKEKQGYLAAGMPTADVIPRKRLKLKRKEIKPSKK